MAFEKRKKPSNLTIPNYINPKIILKCKITNKDLEFK